MRVKTDINLLLLYLFVFPLGSLAQVPSGYSWWQSKHGIQTQTPVDYISRMPAHMGPNALPVPELFDTKIAFRTTASLGAEYFSGRGETTTNPDLSVCFPVQKNRLSLGFRTKLMEQYRMSESLRDRRFARDSAGAGTSRGESFVLLRCRLLQEYYFLPDFSLDAGIKLSSGNNLVNARHTQTPAYWLSGLTGKDVLRFSVCTLRITAALGAYFWQWGDYRRCTAFLYGAGMMVYTKKLQWYNGINGYNGYSGQGDAPLVFRSRMALQFRKCSIYGGYQWGIRDYITHCLQAGIAVKIDLPDRLNPY